MADAAVCRVKWTIAVVNAMANEHLDGSTYIGDIDAKGDVLWIYSLRGHEEDSLFAVECDDSELAVDAVVACELSIQHLGQALGGSRVIACPENEVIE